MRVRQRRARHAALVHEHVHVSGRLVRAHALAPDLDCGLELLGRGLPEAGDRLRRVHDHLVRAGGRPRGEQLGLAAAGAERVDGRLVVARERGVEIGHDANRPARGVGPAAVRAQREHLRRRAVLVALHEGVGLRIDVHRGLDLVEPAGPAGPLAGDDGPQPRQGIDAQLRQGPSPSPRGRSPPRRRVRRAGCSRGASRGPSPQSGRGA